MTTILTDTAATALWHALIREAEHKGDAPLHDEAESYLVFLLMRHQRDAGLADHVMALDYLQALQEGRAARREQLRDVGDRCLLIAGLYPQQAERRLVDLSYFLNLGSHAYAELACAARTAWADLYRHLAASFSRLVRVLIEVRRLSGAADVLNPFGRHALSLADPSAAQREFPGAIVVPAGTRTM